MVTPQENGTVAVTGLGAITALGEDAHSTWTAMLAGRPGVRRLPESWAAELPVRMAARADISRSRWRDMVAPLDRYEQLAMIAAYEAWLDAGLGVDDMPGFLPRGERVGVMVSTGAGGGHSILQAYEAMRKDGWRAVPPGAGTLLTLSSAADQIGAAFGAMAGTHALVSACASGAEAIGHGMQMIRSGRADIVIVGGAEAGVHAYNLGCFASLRALSTRNDEPERASRPFDAARDGFVMGEGAGILILESAAHAACRGAEVYAEAAGAGYSADAYNIVLPEPEGSGQVVSMRRALADAGMPIEEVAHVNAHATSTPQGDVAEAAAIRGLLGRNADNVPVTATKSMTGHMIGAAGAVEAIATVMALHSGQAPPTINVDELDVELDVVREAPRPLPTGSIGALNNAFGFGGHNVSIAFRRASN